MVVAGSRVMVVVGGPVAASAVRHDRGFGAAAARFAVKAVQPRMKAGRPPAAKKRGQNARARPSMAHHVPPILPRRAGIAIEFPNDRLMIDL